MNHYSRLSMVYLGFLVCLLSPISILAQTSNEVRAVIKLTRITADKTTEPDGDELYFNITSYSSLGRSRTERIPQEPAHWDSKYLDKVKDIILWEGSLQDAEEVKLILSVVEQEFPIWQDDELIGGAQVMLENKKGALKHEWVAPHFDEQTDVEMKGESAPHAKDAVFLLKGAGAVYEVAFSIEQK